MSIALREACPDWAAGARLAVKSWRLTFGGGGKRRQVSVPAGDLMKLSEAVAKAKERFGMHVRIPAI